MDDSDSNRTPTPLCHAFNSRCVKRNSTNSWVILTCLAGCPFVEGLSYWVLSLHACFRANLAQYHSTVGYNSASFEDHFGSSPSSHAVQPCWLVGVKHLRLASSVERDNALEAIVQLRRVSLEIWR
eukprot:scaffold6058_cov96-Cylindrotheca_fusiformis.AAC.1